MGWHELRTRIGSERTADNVEFPPAPPPPAPPSACDAPSARAPAGRASLIPDAAAPGRGQVTEGSIEFAVNKVDGETGEFSGVFVSEQLSDTDMGSKAPKKVPPPPPIPLLPSAAWLLFSSVAAVS